MHPISITELDSTHGCGQPPRAGWVAARRGHAIGEEIGRETDTLTQSDKRFEAILSCLSTLRASFSL